MSLYDLIQPQSISAWRTHLHKEWIVMSVVWSLDSPIGNNRHIEILLTEANSSPVNCCHRLIGEQSFCKQLQGSVGGIMPSLSPMKWPFLNLFLICWPQSKQSKALPGELFKNLETTRIAYDRQVVEFKTSCGNNSYICGLLLQYAMDILGLILGQNQTLLQILTFRAQEMAGSDYFVYG